MIKKFNLYKKNILITGVSSGIGRELAVLLHSIYQCRILGVARNKVKLSALKEQLSSGFDFISADVSNRDSWKRIINYMIEINFILDVVINNAGVIHPFDSFLNLSDSEIDKVINTNYKSIIYSMQETVPLLLSAKSPAVINITSAAAGLPVAGGSVYSSSKRAALSFTEAVKEELQSSGIYIAAVMPGPVRTELYNSRTESGEGRAKTADKIISSFGRSARAEAAAIIRGIERKKPLIITGIISKTMTKAYKLSPSISVNSAGKIMRLLPLKTFKKVFIKQNKK